MSNFTNYQTRANQNYNEYHLTQSEWPSSKKKKSTNNKCWRRYGEKYNLPHLVGWKLLEQLWKTVWRFLQKRNLELPYDPAIPLPGIYPQKIIIQKDACALMLTAALFTIVKHGSNLNVREEIQRNRYRCGTHIQWNATQP